MTDAADRLRAICLALPEAAEKAFGRHKRPTYRVNDKMFAMDRHHEDDQAVWLKVPRGNQEIVLNADPHRFFYPPYVGHKGWVGIRLDAGVDWDEVEAFVRRSYRLTAPKRLAALVA
ncbi:MAG: MmcQ/YjbR family DNA-binding protein [Bauldia litoralis]